MLSCLNFSTTVTHGLTQSLNLWPKLCSFKWLNFSRSLISNVQQLFGHALKITIFALMWKIALILICIAWYINVWSFKVVPFCKHKKEKKSSWSLLLVVKTNCIDRCNLVRRISIIYNNLQNVMSKLHRSIHGVIILKKSNNSVFLYLKIYWNRQVFDLIRASGIWMKPEKFCFWKC